MVTRMLIVVCGSHLGRLHVCAGACKPDCIYVEGLVIAFMCECVCVCAWGGG